MKSQLKKATAVAMAMTMCFPGAAFAALTETTEGRAQYDPTLGGTFDTSFDVYSPTLHVEVPLKADIRVNPLADTTQTSGGVDRFSVASNSLDIINASVDTENDTAIPVNVAVVATIANTGEGVVTKYGTLAENKESTEKKIHLALTEANTAATLDMSGAEADSTGKLLKLGTIGFANEAVYGTATNEAVVTAYGSLLSVDIDKPTTSASSFTDDPTQVTPGVGSFAITGTAYTNADWKNTDISVNVTYKIKASNTLGITTPGLTAAPTGTGSTSPVTFVVENVGEAKVLAIAIHNDEKDKYGNYGLEDWEVSYSTAAGQTNATVKIPADHPTLQFLTADGYSGEAQDLIVGLSDGRRVVSTLTITAAP